ncbi:MAG: ATP-binding protein [Chloroflexi bacterium]|nr:ATP-binding protein [Chloroflexota bacterium]
MTSKLFVATRRISETVGREKELEQIKNAIFRPAGDDSCQIVFVQGRGGFGKTRLLDEALWRLGHPAEREARLMTDKHRQQGWDWERLGDTIILHPIDLIDTQLHSSGNFVYELYTRFEKVQIRFSIYISKRGRVEAMLQQGMDYTSVRKAAEESIDSFLKEYAEHATKRRVVWFIDTAEQLTRVGPDWLWSDPDVPPQKYQLQETDLQFQTQQWLANQIKGNRFKNTTIVFAGRDEEGEKFFASIEAAAKSINCKPISLKLDGFDAETVQAYFRSLAEEFEEEAAKPDSDESDAYRKIIPEMKAIAGDDNLPKVLQLYTNGQPVLLSIFADILIESGSMPDPLRDTYQEAIDRLRSPSLSQKEQEVELRWVQWQVEEAFITMLFSQPRGQDTLYRDILQLLVRAPRGLTLNQLHFVLDSSLGTKIESWNPDPKRIAEIEKSLWRMSKGASSLIKRRPNDAFALQDEMYRIYAEHLAPHITLTRQLDNRQANVQYLWETKFKESAKERYRNSYEYEKKYRRALYAQLAEVAEYQLKLGREKLLEIQGGEERHLEQRLSDIPASQPRSLVFPRLESKEREQRRQIHALILDQSLEAMHYRLLLDPSLNFNVAYTDLADEFWRANDGDRDATTQSEMWRLLHDIYALRFVDLKRASSGPKTSLEVLQRAAEQEAVARFLKRFVLRKDYQRAIEFGNAIEHHIETWAQDSAEEVNDKASWLHTLAYGERQAWQKYASILSGRDIENSISFLETIAHDLVLLSQCPNDKEAVKGKLGLGENGFKGHPAETRLRRVVSVIYNFMGYGLTGLRKYRKASAWYGRALYYARELGAKAHRATVLNNLSRAQSEMGRTSRAIRLCLDGLKLRRELGADLPIVLSHNTLALIFNDQNRPEEAWREAAKAMAYARRIEDSRALGLALIPLGEALRRLATPEIRFGRTGRETPEAIYDAAQEVLDEAHLIFSDLEDTASKEPLRLIETKNEMGCLFRDRLQIVKKDDPLWDRSIGSALSLLEDAERRADELNLSQLKLDAAVNIAWTYYFADNFDQASRETDRCASMLQKWIGDEKKSGGSTGNLLMEGEIPPRPADHESAVYYQISRIDHLRGRIAMDRFRARADEFEKEYSGDEPSRRAKRQEAIRDDPQARSFLSEAAKDYARAVGYAQLFSPRSSTLGAIYDTLYDYLRHFNQTEIESFAKFEHAARNAYHLEKIQIEDLSNMGEFLRECFGELTEKELADGID